MELVHARIEGGVGDHVHHAPTLHHVVSVGHGGREAEVLLHEEDGESLRLEAPDGRPDLLDDDGSEAFRGLVEEQEAGPRAQVS